MVYFEGNLLIDQVQGHHNMLEQLVHNYAGLFLVFASIVSILIIYKNFRGSKVVWPTIMAGMIAAGFIGLGDVGEHILTGISPFPHETLHYLHMLGGPVALFLFYSGLKEFTTADAKPLGTLKLGLILLCTLLIPMVLATQADQRWDPDIEGPFLVLTAIPTIIIAFMVLLRAKPAFEAHSTVVLNISFTSIAITLLTLTLLIARMGDVNLLDNGSMYVMGHALADIMHAAAATSILMFGVFTEGLIRSL